MKYFISTLNFSPDSRERISDVIPVMVENKIKNIELSSFHPFENNLEYKLVRYADEYDLNILLHNFSPPEKNGFLLNLCDRETIFREKTRDFIIERINLTKKLGMDYYSFHAGFTVDYNIGVHEYKHKMDKKKALDLFIHELGKIMDVADDEKIHIGIENHVCIRENKDNLILYDIEDFEYLFDEIKSDYLHLHLDTGHLKVTSSEQGVNKKDFVEKFADHIYAAHVHDNTGMKVDCHAPFNHDFWFNEEYFKKLNKLNYLVLETKTYGDMKLINYMKDFFKKMK